MAYQTQTLTVPLDGGVVARHQHIVHDPPADKLLVILPGRGYLLAHPVLHYLRKMAVELGYDVLGVEYSFQAGSRVVEPGAVRWAALTGEIEQAIRALPGRRYARVCLAGKSLGSPPAALQAQSFPADDVSLILLTPVANAVQLAGEVRTLALIGTKDPVYNAGDVAADAVRPNVSWRVFEGLQHGLEVDDDWRASLEALPQIISACEEFLR